MKILFEIHYLLAVAATLALCGCASTDEYQDNKEYSDMPWNTPQQWEGSRSIPGMSPGY
jgi:type IV pilus biogenesis protein CpaD/CtpE